MVDAQKLAAGVSALEGLGFRVRVAPDALDRWLFSAGPPDRRAAALHALFADPEVAGVFCARGGAGGINLLAHLEPQVFARAPKVFVGYSDVTLLHLFLNRLGLVTFHGPLVAAELATGGYDPVSFTKALCQGSVPFCVEGHGMRVLRPGQAEGRLRGGCLSLLAAATGTPWADSPRREPTILLIEDVGESPYRIHRMLSQLRQAGALEGVRGIVFGEMQGCAADASAGYTLEDVLLDGLGGIRIPIAIGLPSGHSPSPMVTLPFGVATRLTCDDPVRLEALEPWLA
jgi:muramoyltetrapeptide carboxypeptidase